MYEICSLQKTYNFHICNTNSVLNIHDSVSTLSNNSMGNKTHKNCRTVISTKNHDRMKQSTSNNDYKNSSLTIYHQNIRGINNKTDELVNQW
jgi:hypothetical protein